MSNASDEEHSRKKFTPISTVQNANWTGSIPVILSLASTSLSSPTAPRPLHKMISRNTYLHVGLYEEVCQLFEFAPAVLALSNSGGTTMMAREEPPESPKDSEEKSSDTLKPKGAINKKDLETDKPDGTSSKEDSNQSTGEPSTSSDNPSKSNPREPIGPSNKNVSSFPECWFEDEESGQPLRWHLFAGVLYDLMKGKAILNNSRRDNSSHHNVIYSHLIPWRIRVHFTSYPKNDLLPLDDSLPASVKSSNNEKALNRDGMKQSRIASLMGRIFRNSLKQALFLQYGSSRVAMSMSKSSNEKIWDSVLTSNYNAYHEVNLELQMGITNAALSLTEETSSTAMDPAAEGKKNVMPQLIPVRVVVDNMPAMQKPCRVCKNAKRAANESGSSLENKNSEECDATTKLLKKLGMKDAPQYTTLGDILSDWLPNLFGDNSSACNVDSKYYCVQGIQPDLNCAVVDLWRGLCHPDHFLYVVVVTSQ